MKLNSSRYILIAVCLFVAIGFVSCGKRGSGNGDTASGKTKSGEIGRVEHETVVKSGELELKAVVTVPAHEVGALVPGVVIVHTFEHLDRDGSFLQKEITFKPYKDLADQLAAHGIASIRFDKRTTPPYLGKINIREMTIEDYYGDALAALERLRTTEGVDPERLFFIGHGEGAVTVPALIEANPDLGVRGLVLIAPPLMRADDLIIRRHQHRIRQIDLFLRHNPQGEEALRPERERTRKGMETYIAAFRMLRDDGEGWEEGRVLDGFCEKYWRHAIELYGENLDRIERLKLPVLIVQGNLDPFVITEDLFRRGQQLAATGHVTIEIQDGVGHNLINPKTQHVHTDATALIANWLLNPPEPTPVPTEGK